MTEVSPGRAAYEGMTAYVAEQPGSDPCSRWEDLQPWQRDRWDAAGAAVAAAVRGVCCDLHGRNCEPPSELCCEGCTEARHCGWTDSKGLRQFGHPAGEVCANPGLSGVRLVADERDEARAARDDYAARLRAADQSWAKLAIERDDLADALRRLAADEWLGTEGHDGDELARRRAYASAMLESAGDVVRGIAGLCERGEDADDETPPYWQVRTALSGTLNVLQIVALCTDDKLAAMAKEALAKADAVMEQGPGALEDDPASRLLALELPPNDSGASTVRGYLIALVTQVWRETEYFSGKKPFGSSDWQDVIYRQMASAGLVQGEFGEDGEFLEVDDITADELILAAIAKLGEVTS